MRDKFRDKYLKYKHKYLSLKYQKYNKLYLNSSGGVLTPAMISKMKINLKKYSDMIIQNKNEKMINLLVNNCNILKKYVNLDLDINIIGTKQPTGPSYNWTECFKILVDSYRDKGENIVLYITFNELNFAKDTKIEKELFEKTCIDSNCKFLSLPVEDYKPHTKDILLQLWYALDDFHKKKEEIGNFHNNVLIHCTAGRGRTGFAIVSYIWLRTLIKNPSYMEPLTTEIFDIIDKDDIDNDTKWKLLKKCTGIKYLTEELEKYSTESKREVFDENYFSELFVDRIKVFKEAYNIYKSQPLYETSLLSKQSSEQLLKPKPIQIPQTLSKYGLSRSKLTQIIDYLHEKHNRYTDDQIFEILIIYLKKNGYSEDQIFEIIDSFK